MGLIRECDIYPGRVKNVEKYVVTVRRFGQGDGEDGLEIRHTTKHMCPAGLLRLDKCLTRGTKAPTKAPKDES